MSKRLFSPRRSHGLKPGLDYRALSTKVISAHPSQCPSKQDTGLFNEVFLKVLFVTAQKGFKTKRGSDLFYCLNLFLTVQIGPLNASAVSLKFNKGLRLRVGGGGSDVASIYVLLLFVLLYT
jgi:hypothetical protein